MPPYIQRASRCFSLQPHLHLQPQQILQADATEHLRAYAIGHTIDEFAAILEGTDMRAESAFDERHVELKCDRSDDYCVRQIVADIIPGLRARPYCRGEQPMILLSAVLKVLSDS